MSKGGGVDLCVLVMFITIPASSQEQVPACLRIFVSEKGRGGGGGGGGS